LSRRTMYSRLSAPQQREGAGSGALSSSTSILPKAS
jgi:hypothetical protein